MTAESNDGQAHNVRMYSDISGGEHLYFLNQLKTHALLFRVLAPRTRPKRFMGLQRWRNQYYPFREIRPASTFCRIWRPCLGCSRILLLQEGEHHIFIGYSHKFTRWMSRSAELRLPGKFLPMSIIEILRRTWTHLLTTRLILEKDYYLSALTFLLLMYYLPANHTRSAGGLY